MYCGLYRPQFRVKSCSLPWWLEITLSPSYCKKNRFVFFKTCIISFSETLEWRADSSRPHIRITQVQKSQFIKDNLFPTHNECKMQLKINSLAKQNKEIRWKTKQCREPLARHRALNLSRLGWHPCGSELQDLKIGPR